MASSDDFDLSIIVPVFNMENYIFFCLESIRNQTYLNYECIIVDDGSTDNSSNIIQKFIKNDSRFKLYRKKNGGLSSARNYGIEKSSGAFISFIDADDFWMPTKLEVQMKYIKKETTKNIIFCNCYLLDEFNNYLEYKGGSYDNKPLDLLVSNSVIGSASSIIIPRSVINTVGKFDETLYAFEDLEFWFRSAISGYVFKYIPNPLVVIRVRLNSLSKNKLKMQNANLLCLERQTHYILNRTEKFSLNELLDVLLKRLNQSRRYFIKGKKLNNIIYYLSVFTIIMKFIFKYQFKILK